ncbi:MAG: MarR family transcriptional regulator [Sedimentisphaerales bacterium]|nr:MarR family transcriptional regulator [Sedimentisphaerales bacterium]
MTLAGELGLKQPLIPQARESILNIYHTATAIKKKADELFRHFGLSDVQFNVLMLLAHESGPKGGLSQSQVSDMMLVNRANITTLIDRMEKSGLVVRTAAQGDRRSNIIKLTPYGRQLLSEVEPIYIDQIKKATVLAAQEQKMLIDMLEKIRGKVNAMSFEKL